MKLLVGNGRELTVWDLGAIILTLRVRPQGPPIKFNGYEILEDGAARERVRSFLAADLYDRS